MMRLDSGSSFDIVGWKRVPKPKSSEVIDTDVAPKAGSAQQGNAGTNREKQEDEQEETNELWYKVRLPPSISPAPAGWIYGKQVELKVPSDIIFYRTGREFVAWQRLDGDSSSDTDASKPKDAARNRSPEVGSFLRRVVPGNLIRWMSLILIASMSLVTTSAIRNTTLHIVVRI